MATVTFKLFVRIAVVLMKFLLCQILKWRYMIGLYTILVFFYLKAALESVDSSASSHYLSQKGVPTKLDDLEIYSFSTSSCPR